MSRCIYFSAMLDLSFLKMAITLQHSKLNRTRFLRGMRQTQKESQPERACSYSTEADDI